VCVLTLVMAQDRLVDGSTGPGVDPSRQAATGSTGWSVRISTRRAGGRALPSTRSSPPTCVAPFPFAAGAFDLVYANFVVEHLDHPDHAFAEWHRVLRPGGSLILLTSNLSNPLIAAARIVPQPVRTAVKRRRASGRVPRSVPSQHARRAQPAARPGRVHPRQRCLCGDAAPLRGQTPLGRGSPAAPSITCRRHVFGRRSSPGTRATTPAQPKVFRSRAG
jgi:SAM-dependent methyltransferase